MKLQLFDKKDVLVAELNDDNLTLADYPAENYMRLHVNFFLRLKNSFFFFFLKN